MCVCVCVCACVRACVRACVLAVYNKAQAQRISNQEFKLWTFLQRTESRVATFLAETCVMSHQVLYFHSNNNYNSKLILKKISCKYN